MRLKDRKVFLPVILVACWTSLAALSLAAWPIFGLKHLLILGVWLGLFLFAVRRFFPPRTFRVSWYLSAALFSLAAVEVFGRHSLKSGGGLGRHSLQPYLMFGRFYGKDEGTPLSEMLTTEGPETYGYAHEGNLYLYPYETTVRSVADRGDFLFQERGRWVERASDPQGLRIFVVGASVASGVGASSEGNRWFVTLEEKVSKALHRPVHIIPAALGSFNSTQERMLLELFVLPHNPDGVIFVDGVNDPASHVRPGDPFNLGMYYQVFYSPIFSLQRWLAEKSAVYRFLFLRSFDVAMENNLKGILADPRRLRNFVDGNVAVYRDNLTSMLERCKERRIPCAAFLQPARAVTFENRGMTWTHSPLDDSLLAYYRQLRVEARELSRKYAYHDLTGIFDAPEIDAQSWYQDPCHFDDRGHRALAEAIFPHALRIARGISAR